MNEAEVKTTEQGPCAVGAAQTLKAFASDVSTEIKRVDPNHLVSLGTIGSGQCGAQGAEYQDIHNLATIDLCEYHDYHSNAPMPGDAFNGLQVRINQCNALGKPLFIGESGIKPTDVDGTLQGRANVFEQKFDAQFAAGVVGELVWAWNKDASTLDNYNIGPGDPVLAVLPGYWLATGAHGKIAFVSSRDGDLEIYSVQPDGRALTRLTTVSGLRRISVVLARRHQDCLCQRAMSSPTTLRRAAISLPAGQNRHLRYERGR